MTSLVDMINMMEVRESDESFKNGVDLTFEALEERDPNHFAVRQYKKFKLSAGVITSKGYVNHIPLNTGSHRVCGLGAHYTEGGQNTQAQQNYNQIRKRGLVLCKN